MARNSLGKTKRFNRELYNRTDGLAKEAIQKYLKKNNHEIITTKENYSCDIESLSEDGTLCFSEAEIKFSWAEEWPKTWEDVRIPYRKQKLLDKIEKDLTFYVLRADCKEAWAIPDTVMKEHATVVEVPNRYVPKGEKFFSIPINHIHIITI